MGIAKKKSKEAQGEKERKKKREQSTGPGSQELKDAIVDPEKGGTTTARKSRLWE